MVNNISKGNLKSWFDHLKILKNIKVSLIFNFKNINTINNTDYLVKITKHLKFN